MPDNKEKEEEKPIVAKTATDLQRLKLQKLMKNPEKPIMLPERPKAKNTPTVPEFVRNVMGSSAGAGSGEFHVYRHLRRKEYARQKFIQEKGYKELLDEEYHRKIEENKRMAEETTAKKRARRLKKKHKLKQKKKMKTTDEQRAKENEDSNSDESSDEENSSDKNDAEESSGEVNDNRLRDDTNLKSDPNESCANQNELSSGFDRSKPSHSMEVDKDKDNNSKEICVNTNDTVSFNKCK